MRVRVCTYICISCEYIYNVCVHIHVYIHMYIYTCIYKCACNVSCVILSRLALLETCASKRMHTYTYIYIYIHTYIFIYIYLHICIYIHIHTYIVLMFYFPFRHGSHFQAPVCMCIDVCALVFGCVGAHKYVLHISCVNV